MSQKLWNKCARMSEEEYTEYAIKEELKIREWAKEECMKDLLGREILPLTVGISTSGCATPPTSGAVCGINVIDPNNPMDEFNKPRPFVNAIQPNLNINDFIPNALQKAIKHDQEKPRWDLLPYDALKQIVEVLTIGAKTYAPRNWESGLSYSRCFAALQRHLTAWFQERENDDPETKKHHLSHAACELLFLLSYELRGIDINLDDRPVVYKKTLGQAQYKG